MRKTKWTVAKSRVMAVHHTAFVVSSKRSRNEAQGALKSGLFYSSLSLSSLSRSACAAASVEPAESTRSPAYFR